MKINKVIDFIRHKNTSKVRLKVSITAFFNNFFISRFDIPTPFVDIFTIIIMTIIIIIIAVTIIN